MVGHLAAWNYLMSLDNPANRDFISNWRSYSDNNMAVSSDPMEAQAMGFQLWVKAAEQARTVAPQAVLKAIIGLEVPNLSGGRARLLPNQHLSKPVYIGQVRSDGQYDVIWHSAGNVDGDPWFDPVSVQSDGGQ